MIPIVNRCPFIRRRDANIPCFNLIEVKFLASTNVKVVTSQVALLPTKSIQVKVEAVKIETTREVARH